MTVTLPYYALPLIVVANAVCFFVLGKFHERWEWNHKYKNVADAVRKHDERVKG